MTENKDQHFEETIADTQKELSTFRKVIKLFEKFEDDLKNADNVVTEQVTVNNLVKKPYQSLVNLLNRNSASLKQKSTIEGKLDKLDENVRILASLILKRSQDLAN